MKSPAKPAPIIEACHLLMDAAEWMEAEQPHKAGCPAIRDDYDCTCGLHDLLFKMTRFCDSIPEDA